MRTFAVVATLGVYVMLHGRLVGQQPPSSTPEAVAATTNPKAVRSTVIGPVILFQPEPLYTKEARKAHIEGNVLVYLDVGKDGKPHNVHLLRSLGYGLDKSALDTVKLYRFTPASEYGQPVQVKMNVEVNFRLFDDPEPQTTAGTVAMPTLLSSPVPEFSEEARHDKKGGSVLVGLEVDEAGLPTHVRVIRGVGYGLDEKAVEAVRHYKFKPAMKDGHPVKVSINIEVNFQITDRDPSHRP